MDCVIDIVSRLGTAIEWQDLEVTAVDVEGTPIRCVSPGTLYRMKRSTVRPKDRMDAEALRRAFGLEDE